MDKDKQAIAFGTLVLGAMEEVRRMEATLPDGFAVDEMVHVITTPDGQDWKISVGRPSEDGEDD